MEEKLKRIRKVFIESGKTQTEIGEKIGRTPQYVWKLLNDNNANPSDSVLRDICREFSINIEWLKDGKGEQQKKRTRNQELQEFSNEIMESLDNSFKKRLILALSKLNETDWEVLEKIANELTKGD